MTLEHAPIVGASLFRIGIFGLITSRNMVRAPTCLESIFNAVNVNPVIFPNAPDAEQVKGEIFAIFTVAIAAAEAAIGSSIALAIYRNRKSTRVDQLNSLKW